MSRIMPQNLTRSVVEELGLSIVKGSYGPDSKFPIEADLSKQFEVSRSVMREAVKMLTAKGLLSARPRQGTRIEPENRWNLLDPDVLRWLLERKFSLKLLIEFTEVRLAIEPQAAYIAAHKATDESLLPIRNAMARMIASESQHEDPLKADIDFHVAILKASSNRFFIELEDLTESALRTSIRITNQIKHAGNIEDHQKILNAIEARDPEAAKAATKELLDEVMALIMTVSENSLPELGLELKT